MRVGFSGIYRHLLFNKSGVHYLDELDLSQTVDRDPQVWALANRQLEGGLQDLIHHQWLVILASWPKPDNYTQLERDCSPPEIFHSHMVIGRNYRSIVHPLLPFIIELHLLSVPQPIQYEYQPLREAL